MELRRKALEQYKGELAGRKAYEKRFALSPREKTQLNMRNLASDSTKLFHDAISAVARKASPEGADISVRESFRGIALHIDLCSTPVTEAPFRQPQDFFVEFNLTPELELFLQEHIALHSS